MADAVPEVTDVDHLYALDPGDFVAARDGLARRLRSGGDREAAAAVKKLKRPTVVAWALNQVARREPGEVERLLRAGAAVRDAQAAVLAGADPAELRDLARTRRSLVSALAAAAAALAGAAHHDQAAATLESASVDEEVGAALRAGRLTRELPPPSGFGLAGMPEMAEPSAVRPDRRELERRRQALERADEALRSAEERVRQAEARRAEAQRALDAARAAAEEASAERERAAAAVAEVEG